MAQFSKSQYNVAFGKALRAFREEAGLTQSRAAMALDNSYNSHAAISNYESGTRSVSTPTVALLAQTYSVEPGDIFTKAAEEYKTLVQEGENVGNSDEGKEEDK